MAMKFPMKQRMHRMNSKIKKPLLFTAMLFWTSRGLEAMAKFMVMMIKKTIGKGYKAGKLFPDKALKSRFPTCIKAAIIAVIMIALADLPR